MNVLDVRGSCYGEHGYFNITRNDPSKIKYVSQGYERCIALEIHRYENKTNLDCIIKYKCAPREGLMGVTWT